MLGWTPYAYVLRCWYLVRMIKVLWAAALKGRRGREMEERAGRRRKGRKGKVRGEEGYSPPNENPGYGPATRHRYYR